jgi:hypothetical protein
MIRDLSSKQIPTASGALKLGFALAALAPAAVWAALPPQYQRAEEIARIIGDGRVEQALRSEPIESLRMIAIDRFEVKSETCKVTVDIVDLPPPTSEGWPPGPRQFDLAVGEGVCR